MKCLAIQRENIKGGNVAFIITTNVQNGVPLHGHKPGDGIFIHKSPHQQTALCQTRLHSDTAAVVLSNVSNIIQSDFLLSFVTNSFTNLLASKPLNT